MTDTAAIVNERAREDAPPTWPGGPAWCCCAQRGWISVLIARQVGMSRRHIYKWLYRFAERGLAGLDEKPNKRGWHRRLHGANDAFEEP